MAITHFEITSIPDTNVIDSKIDGVSLVAGVQHPIANQNLLTWERKTAFEDKPIKTSFQYKVHDNINDLESNIALGELKWNGLEEAPSSSNVELTILNDGVVNLLEELPLNDAVDFIFISSMSGVKNLLIRGNNSYIAQKPNLIDLFYSVFTAKSEGGGDPYFVLSYLVGKDGITSPTVYTLTLKIVSLAVINIESGPDVEEYTEDIDTGSGIINYPIKRETTIVEVSLGYAYGVANVDIEIDSAFLSLNAYNLVYLDYNGDQVEESANTTINVDLELDALGKAQIAVTNYIVVDTADPKIGEVTITLNSINENGALVDGTQEEVLSTSL